MAKRKMNLRICFFIHILVIMAWLLGSVMQTGAQIQKTITGQNNPAFDPRAVQAAVAEGGTIGLKGAFDFGEKTSVTITEDVNTVGEADSITIRASVSPKTGGSITPSGNVMVGYGEGLQFTITPTTGYQIKDVIVDRVSQGAVNIYTFTNITQKHSIKAKFTKQKFTVTIAQGGNVSVSPVGTKKAPYGKKIKLKIKPNSEDVLPILLVNGQQVDTTKSEKIYEFDLTVVGNTSVYATSAVEPTIAPNVKVMDEATAQNLSSISDDGSVLTFNGVTPYLQSLQPGDVILSGVTGTTPYGLLRKVTNVTIDGSQITVETTDATLEDVIEEGEIIISKALTASDITSFVPLVEGVTLQEETIPGPLATVQKCLSLHNVLYDADGNHSTTDDQITANGSLCIGSKFDFALGIGWKKWHWIPYPAVKNLVLSTTLQETIAMSLDSNYDLSFSKEVPIATFYYAPITVGPLVFIPVLTINIGIDAGLSAGITVGVSQNAALTLGLAYHGGDWTPISDFTADFGVDSVPTVHARAWGTVYAGPEFDFMLYGLAGNYVKLEDYYGFELDPFSNPWLSVYAGIRAGAGVKAGIFGHDIKKEFSLLDYRATLLELFGNEPPTITSLGASPMSVFTGGASTVTVVASDRENDPLTCSWSTDGGTLSSTTGCGSVTWTAPGTPATYTVSVSVTDNKEGHSPIASGVSIAVSTPPNYTLTVEKSGNGSGTVTGTGINCGADCSESYTSGTQVPLTASPSSGSTFTSWSGCNSTNGNACTVTMNQNKTVIATFTISKTLTVQKSGTGSGLVTGTGINCGADCSESYTSGTQVTLTASPSSGSAFTSWSGCNSTNGNTCTVTMNQNKTVTATFTAVQTFTISGYVRTQGGIGISGAVLSGLPGNPSTGSDGFYSVKVNYGWSNTVIPTKTGYSFTPPSRSYVNVISNQTNQNYTGTATTVQTSIGFNPLSFSFTAIAGGTNPASQTLSVWNAGAGSLNWTASKTQTWLSISPASGSSTGPANASPVTVSVNISGLSAGTYNGTITILASGASNSPRTIPVTLVLSQSSNTLTVNKTGTGSGTVTGTGINCGADCSESYTSGTQVPLTATADNGSIFTGWSWTPFEGVYNITGNTLTASMYQNVTVTANFAPYSYTLTVHPDWKVTRSGECYLGTVTGPGISCPTICSATYPGGTQVTLTAIPNPNFSFHSWGGYGCSTSNGNTCTVIMNGNKEVWVEFEGNGCPY